MPADPSLPTPPSTFRIHLPSLRARGTAGAMTGGRQEDGSVPWPRCAQHHSTAAAALSPCHKHRRLGPRLPVALSSGSVLRPKGERTAAWPGPTARRRSSTALAGAARS